MGGGGGGKVVTDERRRLVRGAGRDNIGEWAGLGSSVALQPWAWSQGRGRGRSSAVPPPLGGAKPASRAVPAFLYYYLAIEVLFLPLATISPVALAPD